MTKITLNSISITTLVVLTLGCSNQSGRVGSEVTSSVVAYNERDDEIWIEEFWYANYDWPIGVLGQGHKKIGGPISPPYPNAARFRWRDGNKQWHEQEVEIDPPLSDSFTGDIYFRFQPDDSIKATPVTREDLQSGKGGPRIWERNRS